MIKEPIFFERNRVGRVYTGGKLFADLFGDPAVDNYLPEEWIASSVRALNKGSTDPKEGISKIKDSDLYFDDLLKQYPEELLGKVNTFRILVKGLDSAIRLPAQAHPDKPFSRKHFNSNYGKTECWLILGTRPDAKLYFGFKEGVTQADFEAAIDRSETEPDAMEELMEYIYPQVGQMYFVPAKTVHAIGKGCLILEIQEPSDFTIQPEHWCGEYKLSDKEMYLGLSREDAVSCFNFTPADDPQLRPTPIYSGDGVTVEEMVGPKDTDCFIINRIKLAGGEFTLDVKGSYAVYIVTDGNGKVSGDGYEKAVKKGDYFFMPASLMGSFKVSGNIELIETY